mmetsp:Transcript_16794/g.2752  ORF Transcript_16794/g.2752 Transcript_16794/m.2752 type:complete len:99 (+) Transcript_16794:543-839(+)
MISIAASDLELYEFLNYTPLLVSIPLYHCILVAIMAIFFYETAIFSAFLSIFFLVSSVLMGKLPKLVRKHMGEITDKRVKLMRNIIEGIRVVKLYGWD